MPVLQTPPAAGRPGAQAVLAVLQRSVPPFVDPVLFNHGGQVDVMEVADTLDGEYQFNYNGDHYIVMVRGA